MLRHLILPAAVCFHLQASSQGSDIADAGAAPPSERLVHVKVIGFNDFHGHLKSPGVFGRNIAVPASEQPPVGGAEFIAAEVVRLKRSNTLNVVVGAGDFVSGSPLISALFHDEPAVETLNRIGLEFSAVGNHEFDRGAEELLRLQHGGCKSSGGTRDAHSCRGASVGTPVPFEGASFRWLAANVVSSETGQPLLPSHGVKAFDGISVAFVGMTLKATPDLVSPAGIQGLEFRDEAETVNRLIPGLRKLGIEAVVVLLHEGGIQTAGLSDINSCDGDLADSPVVGIVSRMDDAIDLVVTGHTHAAYNCSVDTLDVTLDAGLPKSKPRSTGLPNAAGRLVPVTSSSAYGRVLSDIDLVLDRETRDVVEVRVVNRLVNRSDPELQVAVAADTSVAEIVSSYESLAGPIAAQVLGATEAEVSNRADAAGNMPAGILIADAQLAATRSSDGGGAAIAFMNPGGVRASFVHRTGSGHDSTGRITYGDAFSVQPFGNALVTMTLTGQQLKDVLEQQFAGCLGQKKNRLLIPSRGLKYTWDSTGPCGSRISDLRLVDSGGKAMDVIVDFRGETLRPKAAYRVTVNSFLAAGGDRFTTFISGTERVHGMRDVDALASHLETYKPPMPPYDPASRALLVPRILRKDPVDE